MENKNSNMENRKIEKKMENLEKGIMENGKRKKEKQKI